MMRNRGLLALVAGLTIPAGCGGQAGTTSGSGGSGAVDNVQPIQVNFGPSNDVVNGLYTSVTICVPGTTTCQTIDGVLVDSGSEGLRLLSSLVSLPLPRMADSGGSPLANCATFADNSYAWGPLATASVRMAGEQAASVPIQLIGAPGLPAAPSNCSSAGTAADTVSALGASGVLGIGVFRQDCGQACARLSSPPALYFGCGSSGCTATSVPLASQLQNPVWLFPQDNNGLLISLPSVPSLGARTVAGSMIFGIGTQRNNALGSARVFTTDDVGNFSTTLNGTTNTSSYLDSGSNGLYFLDASTIDLPACPDGDSAFSCPASTVSYTATTTGRNGTATQIGFNVANAEMLFGTGNAAFNDLAGPDAGDFDWGLPFFLGRNTFIAIEGQSTPAGTGPYWAY